MAMDNNSAQVSITNIIPYTNVSQVTCIKKKMYNCRSTDNIR